MLKSVKYKFLTSKEIKPCGWLRRQLRVQADGLSGNLDKVWADIRDSAWIGGDCDGWERVPYWLDGFIPLAYLLEDGDLIKRSKRYVDAIINGQNEDGWICPCPHEARANYDMWAAFLICKALTVYADCSGEKELVSNVLEKTLLQLRTHISEHPLKDWGKSRWFEALISIYWLYEYRPNEWLLDLALTLSNQGLNWKEVFRSGVIENQKNVWTHETHVVNLGMVLKSGALLSRIDKSDADEFAIYALDMLDKYNGMANGHFTGDECLGGISPIRGTELCGVAEAMYSYEQLISITGNTYWAERLEKLAFNAFPATFSTDMWTHQYDQMTNQIEAAPMKDDHVIFGTNSNISNTFGLEPNYGCCTANLSQGFPKFALSTFMISENGLASLVIAPSKVNTVIKGIGVECELVTEYPFRDTLKYIIKTDAPVEFAFDMRIPHSAVSAEVDGKKAECGSVHTIKREWNGTSEINIKLNFEPKIIERPNNMVCVWRGPLLYSIAVKEKWIMNEESNYPYCNYYVYAESKWNYALRSEKDFKVTKQSYDLPFSTERPPLYLTVKASEIDWGYNYGYCKAYPDSRIPLTAPYDITMIPYGCAKLRMTEVPLI